MEQLNQFIERVPKFPARVGFSVLFWTGLRVGELLALTPEDIDMETATLTGNKSFQTIDGRKVVTEPKTPKRNRTVPPSPQAMRHDPAV